MKLSLGGHILLPFNASLLDSSECKTLQNRNGKFMFRDFLSMLMLIVCSSPLPNLTDFVFACLF